ncbi:MAG TPA: hypothetical protein VF844_20405 [Ktedonobacteraceae bacterium]
MLLIRWCGLAAVLAGVLRVITSFMPTIGSVALQIVYFTIDALLLVGIVGLYGFQKQETGRWGFFGFMLALIGAGLLIGHDVDNAIVLLYPVAAFLFAVGTSVLAIRSWAAKTLPRWASAFLITSTLVGILGYVIKGFDVLFVISGVIFGIGFIGAGLTVWGHHIIWGETDAKRRSGF